MIFMNKRTGKICFLRCVHYGFFDGKSQGKARAVLYCKSVFGIKRRNISLKQLTKNFEFIGNL